MTPLWKRSKVNQISQLVADLKSPPKRSGSLVIQTGFPNSLIDLFVKNRNRLKHPSKKKRHRPQVNPPPSPPPTLPSFFSKKGNPTCSLRLEIGKIAPEESELSKIGRNEEIRGSPDSIGVCLSVFKVAFIVIVAFCTKKLILGITLAAFALLLVEYLGDQVLWFFKPCEKVGQRFRSFLSWAEYIYLGKNSGKMEFNGNGLPRGEVRELKDDNSIVSDLSCYFVQQDQEARDRTVDEIELVESNFCSGGGMNEITPRVGIIIDKEAKKMTDEEIERASEVCRNGKGKTGKFWKKYLPKKLQRKKNKKSGKKIHTAESNISKWEEEEEHMKQPHIIDKEGSSSSPLEEEEEELAKEMEQFGSVHGCQRAAGKFSEREKRSGGKSKYLVMVMVVLVGLLRGRIIALALTVICYLVFNMVIRAALKRKNETVVVPPIKICC